MGDFLEMLKARLADAQQRLQVAQAALQKAQLEHNAVMQEFGSWQNAVAVETRREQNSAQATVRIVVGASPPAAARVIASTPAMPSVVPSDINKAELIRDVLRQYPNGITPADLWREVRDQVGRAYVYSVLKRLKDRKQVAERRGKYFLQIVPKASEDNKEPGHIN